MEWDVFISHASEDKESFVKPLASALSDLKVSVWFDMFTLTVGDSLSRAIDKGLMNSRYGIIVISKEFINKAWPDYELRGLINRELGRDKIILPIWHGVSRDDILDFSPSLADKFALNTTNSEIEEIAFKLLEVIRPDIYDNLLRIIAEEEINKNLPRAKIQISKLNIKRPVRHETLHPDLLVRIKIIQRTLSDVFQVSLEDTITNFQRDTNPEKELLIWERIIATYLDLIHERFISKDQRKEIFNVLLATSLDMDEGYYSQLKYLDENNIKEIRRAFELVIPKIK